MGKHSLNPELAFLLLEKKRKRKERRTQGKCTRQSARLVKGGREVC